MAKAYLHDIPIDLFAKYYLNNELDSNTISTNARYQPKTKDKTVPGFYHYLFNITPTSHSETTPDYKLKSVINLNRSSSDIPTLQESGSLLFNTDSKIILIYPTLKETVLNDINYYNSDPLKPRSDISKLQKINEYNLKTEAELFNSIKNVDNSFSYKAGNTSVYYIPTNDPISELFHHQSLYSFYSIIDDTYYYATMQDVISTSLSIDLNKFYIDYTTNDIFNKNTYNLQKLYPNYQILINKKTDDGMFFDNKNKSYYYLIVNKDNKETGRIYQLTKIKELQIHQNENIGYFKDKSGKWKIDGQLTTLNANNKFPPFVNIYSRTWYDSQTQTEILVNGKPIIAKELEYVFIDSYTQEEKYFTQSNIPLSPIIKYHQYMHNLKSELHHSNGLSQNNVPLFSENNKFQYVEVLNSNNNTSKFYFGLHYQDVVNITPETVNKTDISTFLQYNSKTNYSNEKDEPTTNFVTSENNNTERIDVNPIISGEQYQNFKNNQFLNGFSDSFLTTYNNSYFQILKKIYPESVKNDDFVGLTEEEIKTKMNFINKYFYQGHNIFLSSENTTDIQDYMNAKEVLSKIIDSKEFLTLNNFIFTLTPNEYNYIYSLITNLFNKTYNIDTNDFLIIKYNESLFAVSLNYSGENQIIILPIIYYLQKVIKYYKSMITTIPKNFASAKIIENELIIEVYRSLTIDNIDELEANIDNYITDFGSSVTNKITFISYNQLRSILKNIYKYNNIYYTGTANNEILEKMKTSVSSLTNYIFKSPTIIEYPNLSLTKLDMKYYINGVKMNLLNIINQPTKIINNGKNFFNKYSQENIIGFQKYQNDIVEYNKYVNKENSFINNFNKGAYSSITLSPIEYQLIESEVKKQNVLKKIFNYNQFATNNEEIEYKANLLLQNKQNSIISKSEFINNTTKIIKSKDLNYILKPIWYNDIQSKVLNLYSDFVYSNKDINNNFFINNINLFNNIIFNIYNNNKNINNYNTIYNDNDNIKYVFTHSNEDQNVFIKALKFKFEDR